MVVPSWMRAAPRPRALDHGLELAMDRTPSELLADPRRAREQPARVTGAAGRLDHADLAAGHAAHGVDDLAIRVADAATEVVGARLEAIDRVEAEQVRARDVADVHVVADARAVGRVVVGP